jgi:ABC-type uncharacterized transport system permease subunit
VFYRATEAVELLLVFPLMIIGILLTHLVQRWADKTSEGD